MRKFQVTVNGKTYEVDVEEVSGGAQASTPVSKTVAPVAEPVKKEAAPVKSSVGATKVEAPMQGKIVDIRVSEGDVLEVGQVVAVLEAMKMENEVVSPKAGTVTSINVATGQSVDSGDVIISLD